LPSLQRILKSTCPLADFENSPQYFQIVDTGCTNIVIWTERH